jgi:asparagine synthase (glutamine-hydrolysing)
MCGFVGVISKNRTMLAHDQITQMTNAIRHRGPDDAGIWSDEACCIALGHRRLSVVDLSQAGQQPMRSHTGRYVIVFNGEIYNHLKLRSHLKNHDWVGGSDTETLLAAIEKWGIKKAIERCIGMFAFAIWDTKKRELILGRDRLGEKPLYYGWQGKGKNACFLFGSELKTFKAHSGFVSEIDRNTLCLYMRYGYIPAPYSIYQGIYKLLPGCLLTVSDEKPNPVIETYWSVNDVALNGLSTQLDGSAADIADELETLLMSSISQQVIADVPIGAFLSGGVDSSIVVSLMQAQSSQPVKTFTIGFDEQGYNEASYAREIAQHLGTDHTELYVTSQQAMEVIPNLPNIYCEPFSDSSQIPTFLVSKLARQEVTVSLSGDGGDELFGGYNRHVFTHQKWGGISHLPIGLRSIVASGIQCLSPNTWNKLSKPVQALMANKYQLSNIGEKLHKGAKILSVKNSDDLHLMLLTHWNPSDVVLNGSEPMLSHKDSSLNLNGLDDLQKMMMQDTMGYLPDDILVKVDRAAMAVSLESRVPFLDHRVVEFAWRIPQSMKIRDGVGKWILREVLHKHIPKKLIERPKMGFEIPLGTWLRGPLKDWAEHLLNENRLRREGFFNVEIIRKRWVEHQTGKFNWQHLLWNVLMFEAWLDDQS